MVERLDRRLSSWDDMWGNWSGVGVMDERTSRRTENFSSWFCQLELGSIVTFLSEIDQQLQSLIPIRHHLVGESLQKEKGFDLMC